MFVVYTTQQLVESLIVSGTAMPLDVHRHWANEVQKNESVFSTKALFLIDNQNILCFIMRWSLRYFTLAAHKIKAGHKINSFTCMWVWWQRKKFLVFNSIFNCTCWCDSLRANLCFKGRSVFFASWESFDKSGHLMIKEIKVIIITEMTPCINERSSFHQIAFQVFSKTWC